MKTVILDYTTYSNYMLHEVLENCSYKKLPSLFFGKLFLDKIYHASNSQQGIHFRDTVILFLFLFFNKRQLIRDRDIRLKQDNRKYKNQETKNMWTKDRKKYDGINVKFKKAQVYL